VVFSHHDLYVRFNEANLEVLVSPHQKTTSLATGLNTSFFGRSYWGRIFNDAAFFGSDFRASPKMFSFAE
jgi:hypothetical protein